VDVVEKKDVVEKLSRIEVLMRRYAAFRFKNSAIHVDPHKGQGRVLSILKMQPEIAQKQLGYLLGMRNQSLGELLTKLEKNGYIERYPSNEDRRAMMVKLTPAGTEAADEITETHDDSEIVDCLSEKEQDQLCEYLDRMISVLEERVALIESNEHNFDSSRERGFNDLFPDFFDQAHARFHERDRSFGKEGRRRK